MHRMSVAQRNPTLVGQIASMSHVDRLAAIVVIEDNEREDNEHVFIVFIVHGRHSRLRKIPPYLTWGASEPNKAK